MDEGYIYDGYHTRIYEGTYERIPKGAFFDRRIKDVCVSVYYTVLLEKDVSYLKCSFETGFLKEILCISGDLASGKSEAGRAIARQLGYEYFSAGQVFRQLAAEKGMKVMDFTRLAETDPVIDNNIDSRLEEIGRTQQRIVVDSRMAWHFIRDSFKVYLQIDIYEAARRIMLDTRGPMEVYNSLDEALLSIKKRRESEIKRYREKYGADIEDLNNYHLVIDTTHLAREQVVSRIIDMFLSYLKGY